MKRKKDSLPKLGVDFGKVIMGAVIDGKADTSFLGSTLEDAMSSPATPGAISSLRTLVDSFEQRVWIVSKCGPSVQRKTLAWLAYHEIYEKTGLRKDRVRFCRARREKAPICEDLGITHFVDDRLDVLLPMEGIVPHRFLFGEQGAEGARVPDSVTPVFDWAETVRKIELSCRG